MEKKTFLQVIKTGATKFGKPVLIAGGIVLGLLAAGKIFGHNEDEYVERELAPDNTGDVYEVYPVDDEPEEVSEEGEAE